jgi:hypothetical protein
MGVAGDAVGRTDLGGLTRYVGVDLHRGQFTVCTRLENGRRYLRQWRIEELKLFAAQLRKDDEVAVEATGNTRLFYDAVAERAARVRVVNPGQFKAISQSVKKTDKNDAELLALYLSKGLLPEVRMKERKQREVGHLAQTRDLLVDEVANLGQQVVAQLHAQQPGGGLMEHVAFEALNDRGRQVGLAQQPHQRRAVGQVLVISGQAACRLDGEGERNCSFAGSGSTGLGNQVHSHDSESATGIRGWPCHHWVLR